jgi:hypothetical protein
LQFLYKINKDPVEWSNHWRVTVVQLDSEHPDAERHLSGAEMALVGGTWDQYDLSNGMMAEKAFRNMCLAEYEQNKKLDAKELEKATSSVGNTTNFERSIVLGNRSTRGKTMIPPEFTTYLSSKLKEKGEEQKTGRKLREELEALKKKK